MRISRFLAVSRFFEVKKRPIRVQCESGVKFGGGGEGVGGRCDDRDRPKYELW